MADVWRAKGKSISKMFRDGSDNGVHKGQS